MGKQQAIGAAIIVTVLHRCSCPGARRRLGSGPLQTGPVDTGPGTLASARRFLEGRWQLETFRSTGPGQPPLSLKGSGTLIYDDMSNLRMEVRADEASAESAARRRRGHQRRDDLDRGVRPSTYRTGRSPTRSEGRRRSSRAARSRWSGPATGSWMEIS